MGDVIRSHAAIDDILADARSASQAAAARGGGIAERAQTTLGPVLAIIDATEDDLKSARASLAPLGAALDAENEVADAALDRIYDETWNDVGRPANDRFLALMFPGGAGYYTDGDTSAQPARMELLARLYEKRIHPKLNPDQCLTYAKRVRDAAAALKQDLDAASPVMIHVAQLERVRSALGRVAQAELVNLKRMYKVDGLSEAEIHTIIPDRPVQKKAKK